MPHPTAFTSPVGRFTDALLARDLPALDVDRRAAAIDFVERRVAVLPSVTKLGVTLISRSVDTVRRVAGEERMLDLATRLPVPLWSEYPRLVRSLAYTYVWETWPHTSVDGASS
jgi:hypothetical protein